MTFRQILAGVDVEAEPVQCDCLHQAALNRRVDIEGRGLRDRLLGALPPQAELGSQGAHALRRRGPGWRLRDRELDVLTGESPQ